MAAPAGLTMSVKVDWANNGFGSGAYDEISASIVTGEVEWRGGFGSSSPSTCRLTLPNTDGRYWPDNTGSVLYPNVKPGRRVRITATYNSTTYPVFAGYLRRITPSVDSSGVSFVTLYCEDHMGYHQRRKANVAAVPFQSLGTFRKAVLDDLGITTTYRDLSFAPEDDMTSWAHASREPGWDVLEELNEATLTRHYVTAGDDEAVDWYKYYARDRHYYLDTAPYATLTDADYFAIDGLDLDYDKVVNNQDVEATPYAQQPTQIVWGSTKKVELAAGQTRKILARFSEFVYPTYYKRLKTSTLVPIYPGVPTPGEEWLSHNGRPSMPPKMRRISKTSIVGYLTVLTQWSGSGTLTTAVDGYGTHAHITLSNTHVSNPLTVDEVALQGQPVTAVDYEEVTAEDTSSKSAYGTRDGSTISSRYLSNEAQAQGIADHLIFRFKEPRGVPVVTLRNRFPRCLDIEPYWHIGLTSTKAYFSAKRHEVIGIKKSWSKDGIFETRYTLREAPEQSPTDFFDWGDTLGVSSSPRLGY